MPTELWVSTCPVSRAAANAGAGAVRATLLFGLVEGLGCDVSPVAGQTSLQTLCEQAYARIFRLLDAQGLPHLWRAWNYLTDINCESAGMERYRQFNLGRTQAFDRCACGSVEGRVPAACAIEACMSSGCSTDTGGNEQRGCRVVRGAATQPPQWFYS